MGHSILASGPMIPWLWLLETEISFGVEVKEGCKARSHVTLINSNTV